MKSYVPYLMKMKVSLGNLGSEVIPSLASFQYPRDNKIWSTFSLLLKYWLSD
jgi:hypothetical protein